jgi:redox-sensitive bicupin YhaK (pirin superfamily)
MKNIRSIHKASERHWVGDGFPVRTVFHYGDLGEELTPFLLLDHAGPVQFRAGKGAARRRLASAPRLRDRHGGL